jgi:hypothetical protein
LLRRAIEGLAAGHDAEPIDYSPTLAELSEALAEVGAQVTALGERPALVLGPEHLGALLHQASGRLLAKPLAELEREKLALTQASEALRVARQDDLKRLRSWRVIAACLLGGAVLGAGLWGLGLGPLARMLPDGWKAPERLAAATLGLPLGLAGERLLRLDDPNASEALHLGRAIPEAQRSELKGCLRRLAQTTRPQTCMLKLRAP